MIIDPGALKKLAVIVREGAIKPPVLVTHEASSIEIRDPITGRLLYLFLMLPGDPARGSHNFMVANCNEPGFAELVKGVGFAPWQQAMDDLGHILVK